MRVEALLPGVDQNTLAHGGAGLERGEVLGTFFEPELAHAESDGAGADEDDLVAMAAQCVDLGTECVDPVGIELADAAGEDTGAELDDDPLRLCGRATVTSERCAAFVLVRVLASAATEVTEAKVRAWAGARPFSGRLPWSLGAD